MTPAGSPDLSSIPTRLDVRPGKVARNQNLPRLLKAVGLAPGERAQAEAALGGVFDARRMKDGDRYEVARSSDGALAYLLYYATHSSRYRLARSTSGFTAAREDLPVTHRLLGISGTLNGSLWSAMHQAGLSDGAIYQFVDIFAWQIDFLTEPRAGDRFRVVWEQDIVDGEPTPFGRILAARYDGRQTGRHLAVLFHDAQGKDAYYDLEGNSMRKAFLRAPLNYRRISSYFTERRFHPILRIYRPHHGIDYAAAYGTPAGSIGDGVVVSRGMQGGLGNAIKIRHPGGYASIYGHLSRFATGTAPGSHVRAGQVIGYVGMTGLTTGPHLHFGFEKDGKLVNFFKIKLPSAASVSASDMPAFDDAKRQVLSLLGSVPAEAETAQPLATGLIKDNRS